MWILVALLVIVLAYVIWVYNSFVSLRNRARGAWSDVDVQLKRRYDLIPNLVETVKGYASHEKSVFEDVARLRTRAMQLEAAGERDPVEADLTGAIRALFAVAESYPQLRADEGFRDLQKQLGRVEDQIQYARRYYNAVVRDLNTKREMFPSSVVGSLLGIRRMEYFQADDMEREAVPVDMNEESQ